MQDKNKEYRSKQDPHNHPYFMNTNTRLWLLVILACLSTASNATPPTLLRQIKSANLYPVPAFSIYVVPNEPEARRYLQYAAIKLHPEGDVEPVHVHH